MAGILVELRDLFIVLQTSSDHHKRGKDFEGLLNRLFQLFDLNPRQSFSITEEQIDGAFTFDTDDYIMEAKWEKDRAAHADVDILAQKVARKGKNTLGLFVAVSGFSEPAISAHTNCGTGIIFMDGADLYSVLEGHFSLLQVLEAKRRHLNETGEPLFLVSRILD